jgi:serine/threonine protein kinase
VDAFAMLDAACDARYARLGRRSARARPEQNLTEFREFQDGELIAGTRYRVLRLVGVGGMGTVYEVEHVELGKRFVLKALLRELARREDLVARLRNEWRALARLQHANIVNVTDAGTSNNGVPFYVMERLDGDTLAALLKQKRRLHVLKAVGVAASVLDALSAAHEIGIIHRDVKPANIFMVRGGGVKLLDFGVAKIADATSVVTARGLAVGTPRYMSPEQARGERVDGRSDVYASGLILFEMIAGVGPFDDARDANELLLAHLAREAPPLSSVVQGVSPELEQLLASMLAKDCRARPAHARQIAEQLRDFIARHQQAPSTDAPTVQASYAAPTAVPKATAPPSRCEYPTRAEGAARGSSEATTSVSDAALTRPITLSQQTSQVTLSVNTGDRVSTDVAANTTFVSTPVFDGSSPLAMSAIAPAVRSASFTTPSSLSAFPERVDRTEMLSDFAPGISGDAIATRTHVPVPELARPPSVTPPPVVDTGRQVGSKPSRAQRLARQAVFATAGLSVLLLLGLFARRGKSEQGVALASAPLSAPPLRPAASAAPVVVRAVSASAAAALPMAPVPVAAAPASGAAIPVSEASAPAPAPATLRAFAETRRLKASDAAARRLTAVPPTGLFFRAIQARAFISPSAQPPAPAAEPAMPASGL